VLALFVVLILTVVVLFLMYPFWRSKGVMTPLSDQTSVDQQRADLEMEKQRILVSLSELENEHAQGRMAASDYQRLKATDEHRLVKVLDQLDHLTLAAPSSKPNSSKPAVQPTLARMAPVVLAVAVAGGASGIYWYVHGKIGLEARRASSESQAVAGSGVPNPAEMVARLETRLRQNPNDLQGQIMAGRSYMALQRFEDAQKAWVKVVELDRRNHEAHYSLGLILLQTQQTADPKMYEEALGHFDEALINIPREPAVLWYRGVALVHLRRFQEADDSWTTAYQNLSPGSEDAEFVKQALQNLREGKNPLF
jgi:cytochrome c-type biogenesis protein CcmH